MLIREKYKSLFNGPDGRPDRRKQEAAVLLEQAQHGVFTAQARLKEAITTSDLPVQLTPVFQAIALQQYDDIPKEWTNFAARAERNDLRETPYYDFTDDQRNIASENGGKKFIPGGLPKVGELDQYPTIGFTATDRKMGKIEKFGERVAFSWESMINDNQFGAVDRVSTWFGQSAAKQEDIEALRPLVNFADGGINTANFNATNQNVLTGNLPLSYDNLVKALNFLSKQTYNGKKVPLQPKYKLVVPVELEQTARAILAITTIESTSGTPSNRVTTTSNSVLSGKFELAVSSWLTTVNTSADAASTWYLLPTQPINPCLQLSFLSGHATPEIWVKGSVAYTLSGAGVPFRDGSFDNDDYQVRVRHLVTGDFLMPQGTLVSTGTGN